MSTADPFFGETIYEEGEEDSHGISIYNKDKYDASPKIPLEREELVSAIAYTKINDEKHEDYGLFSQNCNDFTADLLSYIGKKGCVGDYLSEEQKERSKLSGNSDFIKCRIPKNYEIGKQRLDEDFQKLRKPDSCNGLVRVGNYTRDGHPVSGYTRVCGRH